ncbi:MAG: hypothetical protein NVSMB38_10520 [Ktedonobacteraceae bacterium]
MRYAVFTDIHANLEALEAVLTKIDELAQQEPIDQIWFLGDLVGYGPNPNECIIMLRERTDVIIAGNHDWAAVGKIDLEDFSAAARTSAEWTAEQLTEEHREFLTNLPERLNLKECTLVHGSPYGPLWEYLTSEVLAERSFEYFTSRYCFVGHTHVPVIFQQPDIVAQTPTVPLKDTEQRGIVSAEDEFEVLDDDEETQKVAVIHPTLQMTKETPHAESVHVESEPSLTSDKQDLDHNEEVIAAHDETAEETQAVAPLAELKDKLELSVETAKSSSSEIVIAEQEQNTALGAKHDGEEDAESPIVVVQGEPITEQQEVSSNGYRKFEIKAKEEETTQEALIASTEDRLNSEIEELLALLGLSQSMIQVTNEMLIPPEGEWVAPRGYRAIVNPGGVGQPRDGDPRTAFMIYDTERGFTFYRIHYNYEKTQEKIIKAGLPPYLATRLGYGR